MKLHPNQTLQQVIDQYPPFLVYALSRTGRPGKAPKASKALKRLPVNLLAARGGLSVRTFTRIAMRISWAGVKLGDIDKFCRGCAVDVLRMRDHMGYIKVTFMEGKQERWSHLNALQWRTFCRLGKKWKAIRNGATA